ncbi:MAG: hypothetical protein HRU15_10945, partial [Planctomycetes bacterium]|nr:hypothetical protein [Planctomycetota bacterium]
MFLRLGRPRLNPNAKAKHTADADPESGKAGADSPTLLQAFNKNVFSGNPANFGVIEESGLIRKDLNDWQNALSALHAIDTSTGSHHSESVLRDPENGDFRPKKGSAAEKSLVKTFIPWGLSATVGEWQFRLMENEVNRVIDEHWYMDPSHVDRGMYRRVPRHNLYGENIKKTSFENGPSEDWRVSALSLNGQNQSLSVSNKVMRMDVTWKNRKKQASAPASDRRTLDMVNCNFLIEALLKTDAQDAAICGKAAKNGYQLGIYKGAARMQLFVDGKVMFSATSNTKLPHGKWCHLIAEVDRQKGSVQFYLDGAAAPSKTNGTMSESSLGNTADFLVGKNKDGAYGAISLDFLRVCQGTLSDAETTIGELYTWQFSGPFLRSAFDETIGK